MKHIELWAAGPHLYLDDFTPPMVDALGAEIKKRNLEVVCLTPEQCAYPINIGAEEDYIRERSVRYFIKAIHVAASLQASNVLVTPGNGYRNKDNTETWVYTLESLQRLSLEAEKSNITLFLEHLTQETTNIAVSARELAKLWKDANCDNIIPMVDTDMMSRENEDIEDYFVATGENIGHVHFVDGLPGRASCFG